MHNTARPSRFTIKLRTSPLCGNGVSLLLILILSVITIPQNTAVAQANDQPQPEKILSPQTLSALDNPDLTIRARVADQLIHDPTLTDEIIYHTLLDSPALTPEQHDRLLEIAEKRRLIQPGVIGIWIDTKLGRPGVGVGRVMPEAPASEVLQAGDIILSLNGFEITGDDPGRELQFAVAASRAGEPLEMIIMRQDRRLTVNTRLADPTTLPGFRGNTLSTSRALQWTLIHDAVTIPPATVTVIDELGSPVQDLDQLISISSNGPEYSDNTTERRRAWQIENEFKSKIAVLKDLEDNSRRLARITDSESLSRAVERRALKLNEKLQKTVADYESFRRSIMTTTTPNQSPDPRRQ